MESYVRNFFFFKQKTAYEMRISDWSSDVCSSDLLAKENQRIEEELSQELMHELSARDGFDVPPSPDLHASEGDAMNIENDGIEDEDDSDEDEEVEAPKTRSKKKPSSKNGRASCRERVCQYV